MSAGTLCHTDRIFSGPNPLHSLWCCRLACTCLQTASALYQAWLGCIVLQHSPMNATCQAPSHIKAQHVQLHRYVMQHEMLAETPRSPLTGWHCVQASWNTSGLVSSTPVSHLPGLLLQGCAVWRLLGPGQLCTEHLRSELLSPCMQLRCQSGLRAACHAELQASSLWITSMHSLGSCLLCPTML